MSDNQKVKKKFPVWCIIVEVLLLVLIVFIILYNVTNSPKQEPEVISAHTLERIINVSELSTLTVAYNGIAEVHDDKKTEKIDFYVSYNATVKAGIEFEKIDITIDHELKEININVPDAFITDIVVDVTSLDFMFIDDTANKTAVAAQALKACEDDVNKECQNEKSILDLAHNNTINAIKALVDPFFEQLDNTYVLNID